MTDIHMSEDVRTALGEDGAAKAGAVTLHHAICLGCQKKIDPEEPVNVVVRIGGRIAHIRYAHAECHPSALVEIPEPRTPAGPQAPQEGAVMRMTAATVDHGGSVLPVLVAELEAPVFLVATGARDLVDVLASHVLARGFSPVGRLRHAPAPAQQWQAACTAPDADGVAQLTVTEPDGAVFYTGTILPPDPWVAWVERYGWAVLYVGKIGLAGLPLGDQPARTRLLREAAAEGRLVGARVPVRHLGRGRTDIGA
ncbi:hypothetical protein [Streptomyces sp. NPDC051561]|uniref:hypothetical protein n=1 Tax=Streptomyces sp. NPDC051561 TaxID=3365658 RepID=UPI0037B9A4D0